MKKYNIVVFNRDIEIVQDDDGKFILPAFLREIEPLGTALKPAFEPIILARKPLEGTVAANVLKWGTGAINVDGCRVGTDDELNGGAYAKNPTQREQMWGAPAGNSWVRGGAGEYCKPPGRWPANFIHDGSEEVLELMPETGASKAGGVGGKDPGMWAGKRQVARGGHDDNGGSAARFFMKCEWDGGLGTDSAARFNYCAKASKRDRDEGCEGAREYSAAERTSRAEGSAGITAYAGATGAAKNFHPTVKPTSLMRYLCRLITPPNGIVLDPFMGSGSTGKAAILEGYRFMGLDITEEYMPIAEARIKWAEANTGMEVEGEGEAAEDGADLTLF